MKKVLLVVALIFAMLMASCGGTNGGVMVKNPTKEIRTQDFVTITYDSISGYATPSLVIDEENLAMEFVDKNLSEIFENEIGYLPSSEKVDALDFFDYSFAENYSNLSNGDTIDVVIVVGEKFSEQGKNLEDIKKLLDIEFTKERLTLLVEGLEEAPIFDPFVDVENHLAFRGENGTGSVSVEFPYGYVYEYGDFKLEYGEYTSLQIPSNKLAISYKGKHLGYISFKHKEDTYLANGDTFTIEAWGSNYSYHLESDIEELGFVIPSMEKQYTASNLGVYYTNDDQLTEDLKEKMIDFLNKTINGAPSSLEIEVADTYYIATLNQGETSKYGEKLLITAYKYKNAFSTTYSVVWLYDIEIRPDGTVSGKTGADILLGAKSLSDALSRANIQGYTRVNINEVNK